MDKQGSERYSSDDEGIVRTVPEGADGVDEEDEDGDDGDHHHVWGEQRCQEVFRREDS